MLTFEGMLIDSAGAMFAGGLVLSLIFPEVPLMVHIIAIALLGGVYVLLGGLRAVMVTDTIQGVLLFIASGVIYFLVFREFGYDWGALPEMAPEDGFTIAPPADDDFLPWPGLFTGVIWLSFYYWVCTTSSCRGFSPRRTSTTAAGGRCSPVSWNCRFSYF